MRVVLLVWLITLIAVLAAAVWFTPVRLSLRFYLDGWAAAVAVHFQAPLLSLQREINISEKIMMAIEHMIRRWREKGEPVKEPLQVTIRRYPRKKIMRAVGRPLRWLGRRTRCSRLEIQADVGGTDAMESAVLAGAAWAATGAALAGISQYLRLPPETARVVIRPDFAAPRLRVSTDCILNLRLGHAIVAGIWLLRRALAEKELVAWVRDSWRRKGVESRGTSDSGPDEDGHGEH